MSQYPPAPQSVDELEANLSEPDAALIESLAALDGDIMFLGVGGKMGPTMARMARRALDAAGSKRKVIGVSRFGSIELRAKLNSWGIETHACDLLDEDAVAQLPDAPLIVSMSGFKFGATQNPSYSWAMNCHVPAIICKRYRASRIVAFSTGNVYGRVPIIDQDGNVNHGSTETDHLQPDGEYAMTAVGRERMYEHFSRTLNIPLVLLRLNYATELRYGVLVDLAHDVAAGRPIDVSMSRVNVIWLADANRLALRAFTHCNSPARVINLAGEEILSLRKTAEQFGTLLQREITIRGTEGTNALLNDGRAGHLILGQPQVPATQMIAWTADWIRRGGESLGKPTHFQTTDGKF
ncbi:NAD-dependent epimerase/dehydratase family protein [Anatilimnocola floriformis]|uniref:NAD-dependent epimerase/dehydratase family protein n=1 Tax=Anatilimnocola floriformis TaxID=2948575 RepID=UPI0020C43255|nr:NAD-dependent epimerase/dehydratase family protein [Anatilimnocola floriformis]